jgi:hypothetical protein
VQVTVIVLNIPTVRFLRPKSLNELFSFSFSFDPHKSLSLWLDPLEGLLVLVLVPFNPNLEVNSSRSLSLSLSILTNLFSPWRKPLKGMLVFLLAVLPHPESASAISSRTRVVYIDKAFPPFDIIIYLDPQSIPT